jgi:hypothetical protein
MGIADSHFTAADMIDADLAVPGWKLCEGDAFP